MPGCVGLVGSGTKAARDAAGDMCVSVCDEGHRQEDTQSSALVHACVQLPGQMQADAFPMGGVSPAT